MHASSEHHGGSGRIRLSATSLIDGSGLSEESVSAVHHAHGAAEGMWHTGHRTPEDARVDGEDGKRATGPGPIADEELTFDLGAAFDLHGAVIWGMNQDDRKFGVKTFEVWVSEESKGDDFSLVPGGPWTLKQSHSGRSPAGAEHVQFRVENVRRVKIDILTNHAGWQWGKVGLSEVRFLGTASVE